MNKKLISVTMVLCLFLLSIISINTTVGKGNVNFLEGDVLYVGGTGPENYSCVQYAIKNSSEGDTIFIYNGTYQYNSLFGSINKSISIVGEDKTTTIIDGLTGIDVFVINISNVIICNLTITRGRCAINVYNSSEGTYISDNVLKNHSEAAIVLNQADGTLINNNQIIENNIGILSGWDVKNSIISKNFISDNVVGIFLKSSYSNLIDDNIISKNSQQGILFDNMYHKPTNNKITDNEINNNNIGIEFIDSEKNYITDNIINENEECGIKFSKSSNSNKIKLNSISNNSGYGICLESSKLNLINKNYFYNNTKNAYFKDCKFNIWLRNFWNRPRFLPYIIKGEKTTLFNKTRNKRNIDFFPLRH